MVQITAYIFIAIILGYFFGWLITKILLRNQYQNKLEALNIKKSVIEEEVLKNLKDELFNYKKENKRLKKQNHKISSGYDGQKYILDEHNEVLDDFQKRLLKKDEVIEALTHKLSLSEEKEREIEKKYEEEIQAFMFERIELTKKYKELLEQYNKLKEHKGMLSKKGSWFSKN
ncbi:MAG: Unknown protein [uncultured Sulfurovum sp.]|uniref:Uncharacterized protein n=1 Tax=uncultured Sulfurovum sp. TaxID=269237 RepID=A0A6S6SCU9_9BACT|nr:MAG: Unknown protein [uncultured Sulfurovum sp.]